MHQYLSVFLKGDAVTFDRKKSLLDGIVSCSPKKTNTHGLFSAALFSMAIVLVFAVRSFT